MKKIKICFILLVFSLSFSGRAQPEHNTESKLAAKQQLEKYRERVIKGEKMADLAVLYSEDPGSAGKGGMYYGIKKGDMDPAFEAIAYSLKQGQVSPVFETVYGYHFIQLVKIRGELRDVRHILIVPK